MRFGSLFAGIGGFDLGLERAGMQCAWQVEIDPYAQKVLAKHWPDVRRHADVCTFPPEEGEWQVDLICGGFPCQDISYAGKGAGLAGARSGLWFEFARIIGELRPRYVVVENVSALLTRGMGEVLGTLASLGYDAEWHVIPASAVGAPHRRDRVWIVAYAEGIGRRAGLCQVGSKRDGSVSGDCGGNAIPNADGRQVRGVNAYSRDGRSLSQQGPKRIVRGSSGGDDVADADCLPGPQQFGYERGDGRPGNACGGGIVGRGSESDGWWLAEPDVGRVAHGIPSRVDRLRCLGNAVVPQVVELIGRAIMEREYGERIVGSE